MQPLYEDKVKRINFNIPRDLHNRLKAKVSTEDKTLKEVLLPFMEAYLNDEKPGAGVQVNGNPGAEVSLLDKKINELLEAKLSGLIEADVNGVDGNEDPEEKIYKTKPMKEYSVEPLAVQANRLPGDQLASVEESVEAERVVEAENGLIATGKKVSLAEKVVVQRRIIGKMIILAEKAKRGYCDWFLDGGSYTLVTAEERDGELAEREKDRLAEREKDRLAEEKEE